MEDWTVPIVKSVIGHILFDLCVEGVFHMHYPCRSTNAQRGVTVLTQQHIRSL